MYRKHVGRALILALMLSGATSMSAQRITRQFKNVPLKTVLAEVEKELQYSIIYKKDEVNERKQITRDFKDASLEEVLSAVLDNGLSYSVQGKMIVISKKEAAGSSITQQKQIIVKGIVKDENGEPVVGANVVEKGTSNGTITDMDGNFSLSISEGSKLSITYIGYLDKDVAVSKGKTTLNIQLKEDTQALDEVVVSGEISTSLPSKLRTYAPYSRKYGAKTITSSSGFRIVLKITFRPLAAPTVIIRFFAANLVPKRWFRDSAIVWRTSSNPALLI